MTDTLRDLTRAHEVDARARSFVGFALAKCLSPSDPWSVMETRGTPPSHIELFRKAAIPALTSASSLAEARLFPNAFAGLVRPREVIGRLVGVRRAPMQTNVPTQTSGMVASWVGEGGYYPAAALALDTEPLPAAKLGLIAPFSKDLARVSDAQNVIEQELVRAVARGTDAAFLDPSLTAVAQSRPASITNGAIQVVRSGSDAESIERDITALLWAISDGTPERPYLIMSPGVALFLATARSTSGDRLFPAVGMMGGTILGVEVLVSAEAGDYLTALDASSLVVADAGVELEPSQVASVAQTDAPSAGPQNLISIFQTNSIAIRVSRFISWARLRSDAVSFLIIDSGSPGSPA